MLDYYFCFFFFFFFLFLLVMFFFFFFFFFSSRRRHTRCGRDWSSDVCSSDLGLDEKIYKPNAVQGRISSAKNNLISPASYEANAEIVGEDRMAKKPEIFRIYKEYAKRCFQAGAMDFDDLLYQTNVLL